MKKSIILFAAIALGILFATTSCNEEDANHAIQPSLNEKTSSQEDGTEESLFDSLSDSLVQWMEKEAKRSDAQLEKSNTPRTLYRVSMSGNTFNGQYAFRRNGCLLIRNTVVVGSPVNLPNGRNPYDAALFSGQPTLGQRGSLWYMTNTAMCALYSYIGCNNAAAALDVAYVSYNSRTRKLTLDVDGRFYGNAASGNAILAMLNIFNATDGLLAQIYRVGSGRMEIEFSSDFSRVAGRINFRGTSFGGYAPASYSATFSGVAASTCNP